LCITARCDAAAILAVAGAIDDDDTRHAAVAERALAEALGGSCYVPLGAYARVLGGNVELSGVVVSPDGTRCLKSSGSAPVGQSVQLGQSVARQLLSDGAGEVIAAAERAGTTA
jgi:hydroxymethylbilane synthase